MNEIKKLLMTGGVLRYRPPHGFYIVLGGKQQPVSQDAGRHAVTTGLVRPNGKDQHGVFLFALSPTARHAMPALPNRPKTLPARPGKTPDALRELPALRRALDPENPARVPLDEGKEGGRVPAGAGRLDAPRAPGIADSQSGQGGCVGCGACAGKGVKA